MTSGARARSSARKDSLRARSGWRTGMLSLSARSLTAVGWILRSRPRGLSGWLTTATTLAKPLSASASRLGHAISAVPKKTALSIDLRNGAQNVAQDVHGRLRGVDGVDEFGTVEIEDGFGVFLVGL